MKRTVLLLMGIAVVALVGCESGGTNYSNFPLEGTARISTSSTRLFDGSYYNTMRIRSPISGDVVVLMMSWGSDPVEDPYIIVSRGHVNVPTAQNVIVEDDDSAGGLDALAIFRAERGSEYTVFFNTWGANDFGQYRYAIGTRAQLLSAQVPADAAGTDKEPKQF